MSNADFAVKNITDPVSDAAIENAILTFNPVVSLLNTYLTIDIYGSPIVQSITTSPLTLYFNSVVLDNKSQAIAPVSPATNYTTVKVSGAGYYKISGSVIFSSLTGKVILYVLVNDVVTRILDLVDVNSQTVLNFILGGNQIISLNKGDELKLIVSSTDVSGTVQVGGIQTPNISFNVERVA